ncbi:transient-receptor-potential-like protein [Corticium candelabrum]|uniref:transient-receptor-potential-like protein n=1 Tax=Corticium candelabrum TaxID=121492 RepID=UPI002E266F7E|nr:transient-receptor-potential-like protein [Corticium candelabrum]
MTKRLKFEHVSVLAEDDVIVQSKRPLITALQVAGQMGRLAESKLDVEKYLEISGRLEKFAIAMTNSQNSSLTELSTEVLFAAVENKQKEFIAENNVQEFLEETWYGRRRSSATHTVLTGFLCLFRLILLPYLLLFYALPRYGRNYHSFTRSFVLDVFPPSARYCAMVITYIFFISLFVNDCTMITGLPVSIQPDIGDHILFGFVLGLMAREVGEMVIRGVRSYFSSWLNCLDITMIVLLIFHFTIRTADLCGAWYFDESHVDLGPYLRVSTLLYGLGAVVAILRLLAYLRPFKTIGPIQVAFKKILKETASFLVIWFVFLLAFAVAMTVVYTASAYGISDNECLRAVANGTDIASMSWNERRQLQYQCAEQIYQQVVPAVVKGLLSSFSSLFYASFGLIDVDDFTTVTDLESVIGKLLLNLWLLVGVVVLVNLLVAIVTNAFQKVQDHADVEWKFARAALLFEIMNSPIFVPPFNLQYYVVLLIARCVTPCLRRHEGELETEDGDVEMTSVASSVGSDRKDLLKCLQQQQEDEYCNNPTTIGDLKKLEEKLEAMQDVLSAISSSAVTCPHCCQLVPLATTEANSRGSDV